MQSIRNCPFHRLRALPTGFLDLKFSVVESKAIRFKGPWIKWKNQKWSFVDVKS